MNLDKDRYFFGNLTKYNGNIAVFFDINSFIFAVNPKNRESYL